MRALVFVVLVYFIAKGAYYTTQHGWDFVLGVLYLALGWLLTVRRIDMLEKPSDAG